MYQAPFNFVIPLSNDDLSNRSEGLCNFAVDHTTQLIQEKCRSFTNNFLPGSPFVTFFLGTFVGQKSVRNIFLLYFPRKPYRNIFLHMNWEQIIQYIPV